MPVQLPDDAHSSDDMHKSMRFDYRARGTTCTSWISTLGITERPSQLLPHDIKQNNVMRVQTTMAISLWGSQLPVSSIIRQDIVFQPPAVVISRQTCLHLIVIDKQLLLLQRQRRIMQLQQESGSFRRVVHKIAGQCRQIWNSGRVCAQEVLY